MCEIYSFIVTVIINEDADIYEIGQFRDCDLERLCRIVGRHDDRDSFPVNHVGFAFISLPERSLIIACYRGSIRQFRPQRRPQQLGAELLAEDTFRSHEPAWQSVKSATRSGQDL